MRQVSSSQNYWFRVNCPRNDTRFSLSQNVWFNDGWRAYVLSVNKWTSYIAHYLSASILLLPTIPYLTLDLFSLSLSHSHTQTLPILSLSRYFSQLVLALSSCQLQNLYTPVTGPETYHPLIWTSTFSRVVSFRSPTGPTVEPLRTANFSGILSQIFRMEGEFRFADFVTISYLLLDPQYLLLDPQYLLLDPQAATIFLEITSIISMSSKQSQLLAEVGY